MESRHVEQPSGLRTSEIRYRRLFEAARDGILILDAGSRKITDANPFMSELLGYPHLELIGKELWEIGLLKDEAANRDAFEVLQDKSFIRYEDLPLQTKAGHRREVEFVSNVYQEDGQSVIQCNIRDITARKRTEMALREAQDQLARHAADLERVVAERTEALRETIGELESFSYSVSHNLRAPLRAMQGFAQILLNKHADQLDTIGREYLERIARSAIRLDSLIRDVLNYTRLLHAAVPLGRVELDRLVHDIVLTGPEWQPPEVDLQIQGPLPAIQGHEGFLTQAISNLVGNAVKFVAPGTSPRVRIWAESTGNGIRLFFQDNGIGIAPEDRGRIFRMFERIHPATEYGGTGIGLTIARKAVERMGG
jgi:PAS domain S-box-containing protein